MSAARPPTLLRRTLGVLKKAAIGTLVALAILGVFEGLMRVVLGAPEQISVRAFPDLDEPFHAQGDLLVPVFQAPDGLSPFSRLPTPGVPRVVFLGGSTVRAGSQLPAESEFPALTASLLGEQGVRIEALNFGRPAMDSHNIDSLSTHLGPIHADVVVIYLGHNDIGNIIMRDRYGGYSASLAVRAHAAASHSRLYTFLGRVIGNDTPVHDGSPVELARIAAAERDFEVALDHTVATLQGQNSRVVLVTAVSDWVNRAPGAPSCSDLLPAQAVDFGKRYRINIRKVSDIQLGRALAVEPDCPDLRFVRGKKAWRAHRRDEAVVDLRYAWEHDPVPLRATPAIAAAMRRVALKRDALLVDLAARFDHELPQPEWFIDVLHLSPKGHAAVAQAVAEVLPVDHAR